MKGIKDLLELYKQFVPIFNNWEPTHNEEIDFYNYSRLVRIYNSLLDILEKGNIIEPYGIKKYKVIESGEIL